MTRNSKSDWSQFVPELVIQAIAYLTTEALTKLRAKDWRKGLLSRVRRAVTWLFSDWRFMLPLSIAAIATATAAGIYSDHRLLIYSVGHFLGGLVIWGLIVGNPAKLLQRRKRSLQTEWVPVELSPGVGNARLAQRYLDPPNEIRSDDVYFRLGGNDAFAFDTNAQIRYLRRGDDSSIEVDFRLPEPHSQISSVCFLINSANSQALYANEVIGEIQLTFRDAPSIVEKLVLGDNIREWCPGNRGDFVREANSPLLRKAVWQGLARSGAAAIMDCLEVPVYDCMRSSTLEKIVFAHRPLKRATDTRGVHYLVCGITLKKVTES